MPGDMIINQADQPAYSEFMYDRGEPADIRLGLAPGQSFARLGNAQFIGPMTVRVGDQTYALDTNADLSTKRTETVLVTEDGLQIVHQRIRPPEWHPATGGGGVNNAIDVESKRQQ
ncbi:MAG: hypothetical protein AAF328_11285 [Planctomycetota bacterium]